MPAKKTAAKVLRPGTEIEVGGEHLRVLPLTLDQIFENAELLEKIAGELKDSSPIKILQRHKHDIYRIVSSSVGKDDEFIGSLSANDAFTVLEAFFKENSSFFIDRLIPIIKNLFPEVLEVATTTDGEQLSPNLATSDTDGQKAED